MNWSVARYRDFKFAKSQSIFSEIYFFINNTILNLKLYHDIYSYQKQRHVKYELILSVATYRDSILASYQAWFLKTQKFTINIIHYLQIRINIYGYEMHIALK